MSRMSEMQYGPIIDAQGQLEAGEDITLQETQCALINAITHIRTLERKLERLEKQVSTLSLVGAE